MNRHCCNEIIYRISSVPASLFGRYGFRGSFYCIDMVFATVFSRCGLRGFRRSRCDVRVTSGLMWLLRLLISSKWSSRPYLIDMVSLILSTESPKPPSYNCIDMNSAPRSNRYGRCGTNYGPPLVSALLLTLRGRRGTFYGIDVVSAALAIRSRRYPGSY